MDPLTKPELEALIRSVEAFDSYGVEVGIHWKHWYGIGGCLL